MVAFGREPRRQQTIRKASALGRLLLSVSSEPQLRLMNHRGVSSLRAWSTKRCSTPQPELALEWP